MKPKEPYVRRHVHRWQIVGRRPAQVAHFDYWKQRDEPARCLKLTRGCADCDVRQSADVPDESVLVPGYEAVSDCDWKDEV